LLNELKMPIIGVVENMKMDVGEDIEEETGKLGLKYLGEIPYDPKVEGAIGNEGELLNTVIAKKLRKIAKSIVLKQKRDP
jgi:ATP-binding protein involved in chromosome partitioning